MTQMKGKEEEKETERPRKLMSDTKEQKREEEEMIGRRTQVWLKKLNAKEIMKWRKGKEEEEETGRQRKTNDR